MSYAPGGVSTAIRLLQAVAGELRDLASDTARFGESLSDHGRIVQDNASIRLLQKFDLFSQSLQAHAVLIDNLSGRLDQGSIDMEQVDELLRNVPFFSVRERLRAVVNGAVAALPAEETADEWYLGE
jgi:hypothetical protein